MRILAIDFGKRRTGLAVTDAAQLIAGPLTTVETPGLLDFIVDYARREPLETIVMGLPYRPDGRPSENQARVRCFAGRLRKALPDVPVAFYDERYTTVIAHRAIIDSGVGRERRRNDKGLVDALSACIILEDYLEAKRGGRLPR